MRKRLIIHIGMHKTGSTAIQHVLSRNRLALRAFGVLYPPSYGSDGARQAKHNALFSAISHEADYGAPHPQIGPAEDLVRDLRDRVLRSGARSAVISAEGFSGEKPAFARALAPLGDTFDVRVIAFLRRPDAWLESFHRQMIVSRSVRETRSLAVFARAPSTRLHLDYPQILTWWVEAFGGNALRVAEYAPDGCAHVRRFLTLAKLPTALALTPASRGRRNPSATMDEALKRRAENRGAGQRADPSDFRLEVDEKRALLSRLKGDWAASLSTLEERTKAPPFIPLMLKAIEMESTEW